MCGRQGVKKNENPNLEKKKKKKNHTHTHTHTHIPTTNKQISHAQRHAVRITPTLWCRAALRSGRTSRASLLGRAAPPPPSRSALPGASEGVKEKNEDEKKEGRERP